MNATAVVVSTNRRPREVEPTVQAVSAQTPPEVPIVIVAAGHVDEWRDRVGAGSLHLIEADGSGSARARMLAVEAVDDVALFTDDDCIPRAGWFAALTEAMRDEDVGAAGGAILPVWPNGRAPWWISGAIAPYFGGRSSGPGTRQRPFGANMALRKNAVLGVGGLRSDLGNTPVARGMHEETELCDRIAAAGWVVAEVPAAVVDHRVRPDQISWRWLIARARTEGLSDLIRDAPALHPMEKLAKLIVFGLSTPLALVWPRHLSLMVARLVENWAYLSGMFGRIRTRGHEDEPARTRIGR